MDENNLTRRALLKKLGGTAAAAAGIASLPSWAAAANDEKICPSGLRIHPASSGYRAAVIVYLFGGHDSNNLIVPLDPPAYQSYAAIRGQLALPQAELLPITARNGEQYGLHPAARELQGLYETGHLAIIASVGNSSRPTGHLDAALHYLPGGYTIPGWAARWIGVERLTAGSHVVTGFPAPHRKPHSSALAVLQVKHALARDVFIDDIQTFADKSPAQLRTRFPGAGLGQQLRHVAGLMASASRIGATRQVFLCGLGGFDTHSRQLERHGRLMRELSEALSAFYRATEELGLSKQVVTYTDSEFNRTLEPNGQGGTGHGWAGHQIVMGSVVHGGDVIGEFPVMALGGPSDAEHAGVWRSTIDEDHYSAMIARWLGVPGAAFPSMFPSLAGRAASLDVFA